MRVYVLWVNDQDDGETVIRAIFSSWELAQSYADDHAIWWYTIEEYELNQVE